MPVTMCTPLLELQMLPEGFWYYGRAFIGFAPLHSLMYLHRFTLIYYNYPVPDRIN